MAWLIEESHDCGANWRHADLTGCYHQPHAAMLEALAIIEDEWRPPPSALHELTTALTEESTTNYWARAIRVVRAGRWPSAGAADANTR